MLTVERLKEVLEYDPFDGRFIWKKRISLRVLIGSVANALDKDGYIQIGIDGGKYKAHRLAWFWAHGVWPTDDIDHKNGIASDNRIDNLRLSTRSQNNANGKRPVTSTSGLKGAYWNKKQRCWQSYIQKNKKHYYLGQFKTAEEAHAAYVAGAEKMFGEFDRAA
jgi:hypothetical protein